MTQYLLPDRRLTRLCQHLTSQIGWSLSPPLVTAFSNQYYWTMAEFNIICVPAAEETSLLSLPALFHELGHILHLARWETLVANFLKELADYIFQQRRRVATEQRPTEYRSLYTVLFAQWEGTWLLEFVADMVAPI